MDKLVTLTTRWFDNDDWIKTVTTLGHIVSITAWRNEFDELCYAVRLNGSGGELQLHKDDIQQLPQDWIDALELAAEETGEIIR
jgi:hypothetical protein